MTSVRLLWRKTGARPACGDLGHSELRLGLETVRDDPIFALWWLVALRGLRRRGEVVGLRWEDIDLAAGELSIREQVVAIGGRECLGPPKSPAGVRRLALDEVTVAVLWELWRAEERRAGQPPSGRVFRQRSGRPVRPDWLTRRFTALVKQVGLPPVRLHDLRHGAASIAAAAGAELKVIQHDLGHSSAVTTADMYVSVFRQLAAQTARASAELLLSHARIQLSLGGAAQA